MISYSVYSTDFHPMKGDVMDGINIIAPSGKIFKLKNTINGWMVTDLEGNEVSGYLPGANDVTYFVVNGLASH